MISFLRNMIFCGVLGFLVNWGCDQVASTFLRDFLRANLVVVLVALTAINATTMGVVLTQLREMLDRRGDPVSKFEKTTGELRLAFLEQMGLVAFAIAGETAATSAHFLILASQAEWLGQALATGTFIYALYITYDTANSIFVLLGFRS
jgi:hypothetical protein